MRNSAILWVFLFILTIIFLAPTTAKSDTVMEFASKIHKISECVPLSVTSWHRSEERNRLVGGHPHSKHLVGLGMDVVLDNPEDIKYFIRRLDDMNLEYRNEGDHIHIQTRQR